MPVVNQSVDPRIRRTKRNLKNTFIELMKEKPYHMITVTDIVKNADYNRTTFYRHYQDKEELVADLVEDMTNELIAAFRFPYQNSSSVRITKLTPAEVTIFDYIYKNKNFYSLWKDSEGIPGFQEKFIETLIELHKEDIKYQIEGEDEYFFTYRAYGVWGLILNWIKHDFHPSSEKMAEQLIKIINHQPAPVYFIKQ